MADNSEPAGHTRWGRFALAVVPAGVAVIAVVGSLYTGLLAATFAVGGVDVTINSDQVQAEGMAAFGNGVSLVDGGSRQVATAGIGSATLSGLCAAIEVPVPVFGGFTVKILAPRDAPVTATDLVLDATTLNGDLYAENIVIGRDASTVDKGPVRGAAGSNGIQTDHATITGLDAKAYKISAGTFRVSGVSIAVAGKGDGC